MQVTVVQLLHRRRLKTLAPSSPKSKVASRQHGTHLRCQTQTEAVVVNQTQTGSDVQPFQHIELVLHIHCCRLVAGRSRLCALRGFQIVVAVFHTGIQRILIGQIKDTLQLRHHALLVTL